MSNSGNLANHFVEMTELLRGCYKVSSYFRVILPLLLLRRLDCVLEQTKEAVLAAHQKLSPTLTGDALDAALNDIAGQPFHNHSLLNLQSIRSVPREVHLNLPGYIGNFSGNVREVFEQLGFNEQIAKLHKDNLLFLVIRKLCEIDLDPAVVSNSAMEEVFDGVFKALNDFTLQDIGEHATTPLDVARLSVGLLFAPDEKRNTASDATRTLCDPCCGTGGILLEARRYWQKHRPVCKLAVSGQDINRESCAVAAAKLLLGGHASAPALGDALLQDQFSGQQFDYLVANPPIGLEWKRQQKQIMQEHEQQGFAGRFGAGLPRVGDSSLLFLQHMLAKFKPIDEDGVQSGSRMAILLNAASLLNGDAGSGESDIRKWVIENDWLDAVIALPPEMHYHTGIGTFICLLTNRKAPERRGKIQLIDARTRVAALPRSIGNKRMGFSERQIAAILHDYTGMQLNATTKIVDNAGFGYRRVTIERPLRLTFQITIERKERFLNACPELLDDLRTIERVIGYDLHWNWNDIWARVQSALDEGKIKWRIPQIKVFREVFTEIDANAMPVIAKSAALASAGIADYEAAPALRDYENVPLKEDLQTWFAREVLPHAPDAWISPGNTKVGYEINLQRHFYNIVPPRPLGEIDADLMRVEQRIANLLREVTA